MSCADAVVVGAESCTADGDVARSAFLEEGVMIAALRSGIGSMCGRFVRRGWRRMPGRHFANFARVAVRKFYVHSSML